MKSLNLLLTATALCIAALGCHTTPSRMTYLPNHASSSSENSNGDKIAPEDNLLATDVPISTTNITANCNWPDYRDWTRDPKSLEGFTIHFDYDSSVVKSEELPKLREIAAYLNANSLKAVCIEGHCDEQGTEEYNRSLGDRRALALREALAKLDVSPDRLDTISFGKDRPIDFAKTEAANRQNRRGEFVVLSPPK